MRYRFNPALRTISIIVLAFFTWTFGGLFEVAYAIESQQTAATTKQKAAQQAAAPKEQRPEEKFEKGIEEIIQHFEKLQQVQTDKERDDEKGKLKAKILEINSLDADIRKQFADTEKKLKDAKLPDEILQRHYTFVKSYEDNLTELNKNILAIDKAKTKAEIDAEVLKAKPFFEKIKPPKKHQPLDPNKLPHRTAEPVWKEPRTKPEEFTEDKELKAKSGGQKQILLASNGPLDGLLSANTQYNTKTSDLLPDGSYQVALASPPTSADLAETIEVKFTPAITAKAAELGNNPLKIYEWVRNNIEYVPTYGSIQGADYCLQTKLCNDFDTASLLIALLRASGVHARYVYGTIEVPIEKVKNWAGGFTDSMAVLTYMATGGIPIGGITEGGQIVTVRLEHMWAEAWLDMIPSHGAIHKQGDTWIPLDASFKEHDFKHGVDLSASVPFDSVALDNALINAATINVQEGWITGIDGSLAIAAVEDYRARTETYMSQNYQNASVADIVGTTVIAKQEFPMLMGTLPYDTIVGGTVYHEIPI